ncbi:isochorismatase family protein [Sediminivirga luteola]|nr:isochorismatase family protein [Sediminivirga luteola]
MDALMIVDPAPRDSEQVRAADEALAPLVERVRRTGGVLVQVLDADDGPAPGPPEELSGYERSAIGLGPDDLIVASGLPDAFEGVPELAEGLEDIGVDRVVLTGHDGQAVLQTALGALASEFEVVVATDAVVPAEDVDAARLTAELEPFGGVCRPAGDLWLRL